LSEDRGRRGTAMRGFDDRQHARGPAFLVQARAEVDVFVVGEEAWLEKPIADRRSPIERGGCRDAPSLGQRPTANGQPASDLPEGPVADVDAGAVDGALVATN